MTLASPWFDLSRRPQRRYLAGLSGSSGPVVRSPDLIAALSVELNRVWASRLEIPPEAMLPCASRADALRLVASAALLPGDRVRIAQPGQEAWAAAIIAAGAAFVDLGRLGDGSLDPSTLAASAPGRLAILGAPAPTGHDDGRSWSARPGELRLADASLAATLGGRVVPEADLSLIILRDPDRPAWPLLAALCGAPADVEALRLLAGPNPLPVALLQRALDAARRISPAREAEFSAALGARAEAIATTLELGPGQIWLPQAGISRAVRCLAADGAALVTQGQRQGYPGAAWGAHPGAGLVRFALLR